MLKVLQYLRELIENDPVILHHIGKYSTDDERGIACIAYQSAPKDMPFPYIVLNVQSNVEEENQAVDRMVYTTDVYTDNGDIETAFLLADRIDAIFNKHKLPPEVGIGIWRENKFPLINEDDLAVQHIHISFLVRFGQLV